MQGGNEAAGNCAAGNCTGENVKPVKLCTGEIFQLIKQRQGIMDQGMIGPRIEQEQSSG